MADFQLLNAAWVRSSGVRIVTITKGPAFLDNVFRPGEAHYLVTAAATATVKELPVRGVGQGGPAAAGSGGGAGGIGEAEQEETEGYVHPEERGSSVG